MPITAPPPAINWPAETGALAGALICIIAKAGSAVTVYDGPGHAGRLRDVLREIEAYAEARLAAYEAATRWP